MGREGEGFEDEEEKSEDATIGKQQKVERVKVLGNSIEPTKPEEDAGGRVKYGADWCSGG